MSVTLSLFAGVGAQFLDNNGNILSGGLIYTYNAGTTTPLTTYTTNIGNVAQSNPIVLDSSGRITTGELWLLNGFGYKFVVKDSNNVLIGTYDNVPSSAQPPIVNDASSIAYEQGNSTTAGAFIIGQTYLITFIGTTNFQLIGASANQIGVHFIATGVGSGTGTAEYSRTVQAKFQEYISVKDFGALGDGVTNDFVAIQNAVSQGGTIFFPAGTYLITTSTCIVVPSNTTLVGEGASTIIKVSAACFTGNQYTQIQAVFANFVSPLGYNPCGYSLAVKWDASHATMTNIVFDSLQFNLNYAGGGANAATTYFNAIHLENVTNCTVKNCNFIASLTTPDVNGFSTVWFTNADNTIADNCYFNYSTGVQVYLCNDTTVANSRFDNPVGTAIETQGGQFINLLNNYVQSPVWLVSAIGMNSQYGNVSGNTVTGNTTGGITGITLGHVGTGYYGNSVEPDFSTCTNNHIYQIAAPVGILMQAGANVIISGNIINSCDPTDIRGAGVITLQNAGICMASDVTNVEVYDNTISYCCNGIIYRSNGSGYVTISNNNISNIIGTLNSPLNKFWAAIEIQTNGSFSTGSFVTISENMLNNCNYGILGCDYAKSANIIGNNINNMIYFGIYVGGNSTVNVLNNYMVDCTQQANGSYCAVNETNNANVSGNIALAISYPALYAFQITKYLSAAAPTQLMCYGNFNIGNTNDLNTVAGYGTVTLRGGV